MKWLEAIELLNQKKKVKSDGMYEGVYLFREGDKIMHKTSIRGKIDEVNVLCQTWWDSNWEEYKERDDWNFMNDGGYSSAGPRMRKLKAKLLGDYENIPLTCRDEEGRVCVSLAEVEKRTHKRFGF